MDDTPGKTLSSLIVAEKSRPNNPGGCVGMFFQLFDWNRRLAKKKLFSNRFILGAKTKKAPKFRDDKLPMAKLLLIADENKGGCPDAKRSVCSNHCSSICAEWKHKSIHSPGIVGRLMGLDTMPAVGSSQTNVLEPHLSNTRRKLAESLDGDPYPEVRKKLVEYKPQKLQITGIIEGRPSVKSESFPFRTMVSRSRNHHHHHQKLIYPVRNSSSHHGRNTVRLMDAATKILEPGFLATSRSKCTLPCPTKPLTPADGISTTEVIYNNFPIPECEKLKTNTDEQETVEFSASYADVNVGDIQNSAEMKLNPWVPVNDLEQGTTNESEFGKTGSVKNEEWFRVNSNVKSDLQRMEGNYEVMNNRKPCDGGHHDLVVSTRKMNYQKCEDKHIKIGPPPNALNLNNQKERQVLMVKDGWRENARPCIKYTRRCSSCQAPKGTTVSHRSLSKPIQTRTYTRQVNQCDATLNERGVKKRCNFDKEDDPLLRANTLHCKKKTIHGNSNDGIISENVYSNERTLKLSTPPCNGVSSRAHASQNNINRRRRHAQPEHGITNNVKREMNSSVTQTDAISFTFTSPMRSSSRKSKKTDEDDTVYGASNRLNGAYNSPQNSFLQKKMPSSTHSRKVSSDESKDGRGDSLSALLELKLRELTSSQGSELKRFLSKNTSVAQSEISIEAQEKSVILILQDLLSALLAKQSACNELPNNSSTGFSDCDTLQFGYLAETECSSISDGLVHENRSPQSVAHARVENIKALSGFPSESKYGDSTAAGSDVKARTSKHTFVNDSIHQSPVSILDVSFSNESCFSSEGYDGCRGNLLHLSCSGCSPVRSEKYVVDMELIDSATSRNNSNQWGDGTVDTSCSLMYRISDSTGTLVEDACPPTSEKLQVDYIKRILSNIKLSFDNIALFGVHHSCFAVPCLFEKLESLMIRKHSKTGCMSDFVRTEGYHKRRLIFDFVMNYMALKFHPYSQSRFGALNKLPMLVSHERLSREISEEVISLQILQGSVLDEIVEWEMNTQLGEWMDLEIEVFETAVDIEKCILRNLVTEAILDVLQI